MAMIRVSVYGHPELVPFEMHPPQPAEVVEKKVANVLRCKTGTLTHGQILLAGNAPVLAGEYVFIPDAAQATGLQPAGGNVDERIEQHLQPMKQEVLALARKLRDSEKSTRSATDVGKAVMSRISWQRDRTAEIKGMLYERCAEPQTVAEDLLAIIPHSWEQLAKAELLQREREKGQSSGSMSVAEQPEQGPAESRASEDQQTGNRKVKEATIQLGMMYIFRVVKHLIPGVCWHVHDTSQAGLAGKQGLIDVSFVPSTLVVWAQLLFFGEFKTQLQSTKTHTAVIGQLSDRSVEVFKRQPPQRSHIFGFAAGGDAVQLVCWRRDTDAIRTNREPFSFEAASSGLLLLLDLLLAKKGAHGFVETQPPIISVPGATLSDFELVDWRAPDEKQSLGACSSIPENAVLDQAVSSTIRSSQVWRATLSPWHAQLPQMVAIKIGSHNFIAQEARMYQHLANVPGLVGMVHSNVAAQQEPAFLVTSPFGRCLEMTDDAPLIVGALACAATTIGRLADLDPPVLHRDLSLGNIIVVPEILNRALQEGNLDGAYLLDLATARAAPGGQLASSSIEELTGTPLFMAISILEGEPHTASSDLESLFLVLIYLGCCGHVHWANIPPGWRNASALKLIALSEPYFDKYVRKRCRPELLPVVDRLQKLFFVPKYNRNVTAPEFLRELAG